jgi:hypothetical protein
MRRGAAPGVEGERDADEGDAEELEEMAHPPAPAAGRQQQRGVERDAEPHRADDDDQVGRPPREGEGPHGAVRDDQEEEQAHGGERVGVGVACLRQRRDRARVEQDADPGDGERREERAEQAPDDGHVLGTPHRGQRGEREDRGAGGERGAPGERHEAVGPEQHAGRGQPVEGQQKGHRGERPAGDDGAAVAHAQAARRERDARHRRHRRADGHDEEVPLAVDRGVALAHHEVHARGGHGGARRDQQEVRAQSAAQEPVHSRSCRTFVRGLDQPGPCADGGSSPRRPP